MTDTFSESGEEKEQDRHDELVAILARIEQKLDSLKSGGTVHVTLGEKKEGGKQ
jgi:hypothetical protein